MASQGERMNLGRKALRSVGALAQSLESMDPQARSRSDEAVLKAAQDLQAALEEEWLLQDTAPAPGRRGVTVTAQQLRRKLYTLRSLVASRFCDHVSVACALGCLF